MAAALAPPGRLGGSGLRPQRMPSPLGSTQPAEQAAMAYIAFRRDAAAGAVARGGGCRNSMPPVPIEGLELGRHVGSGSFGNVFMGKWREQTVAVKVRRHCTVPPLCCAVTPCHTHPAARLLSQVRCMT